MNKIKIYLKKIKPLMMLWFKINKKYDVLLTRVSPVLTSKRVYRRSFCQPLNLENPKGFNEKLMWLKLFWRHPLVSKCADKYAVREYIKECGCDSALNELIGIYNSVHEIDWDRLPDRFALKCTHGSGWNIICHDKNKLEQRLASKKLRKWMSMDYGLLYAEIHYSRIKPRILCERYLEEGPNRLLHDYKIFCFNGEPKFVMVCQEEDTKQFYHDLETWELLPYNKLSKESRERTNRPDSIHDMIRLSRVLAKPFPFVRIDFYDSNGKPIFGEMTFTPSGCVDSRLLPDADILIGEMLHLPQRYTV